LTAVAINEWDIRRGCSIVNQIRHPFLLRRIARSARQDAIRLEAALRLNDEDLIVAITRHTKDIALRWRGAVHLDDPMLFTEIALFKPTDPHLEKIRNEAHQALINRLDDLRWKGHTDQLESYLFKVTHTPFKIEAFLRLQAYQTRPTVLEHMAQQDYRFTADDLIKDLFAKIQLSGWLVMQNHETASCRFCHGHGRLMSSGRAVDGRIPVSHSLPCPECHTTGRVVFRKISCSQKNQTSVIFRLVDIET
jgi:hypothetical protein